MGTGKEPGKAARLHTPKGQGSVMVPCSRCGATTKKFLSSVMSSKRHYCSRKCHLADRLGEANSNWRGARRIRICSHCGSSFERSDAESKRGRGKFCSRSCKVESQRIHASDKARRRESGRRREALERASRSDIGAHTPQEWEHIKALAKHRCVKCKKKKPLTRDHIIPLSKGGTDLITNIQPLCHSCNCRKHNKIETLL